MIYDWSFFIGRDKYVECGEQLMKYVINWGDISENHIIENKKFRTPYLLSTCSNSKKITVDVITWRMPEKELKNLGVFIVGWANQSHIDNTNETVIIKSTRKVRKATKYRCDIQICAN